MKFSSVAGLITGQDLIRGLKGNVDNVNCVIIPDVMLRSKDEPVFLDDLTVDDIASAIGKDVIAIPCGGEALFDVLYTMIGG